MNKELLAQTLEIIKKGTFPRGFPDFGGAGLIITNNSNKAFRDQDDLTIIYTEHSSAISWLVNELKKIFSSEINSRNKYNFYPFVGQTIRSSIKSNDDIFEILENILVESEEFIRSES